MRTQRRQVNRGNRRENRLRPIINLSWSRYTKKKMELCGRRFRIFRLISGAQSSKTILHHYKWRRLKKTEIRTSVTICIMCKSVHIRLILPRLLKKKTGPRARMRKWLDQTSKSILVSNWFKRAIIKKTSLTLYCFTTSR